MAFAYRRGTTFYVGYVNELGKKAQHASKARTLTEARRLAEELERKAERIRLGLEAPRPTDITYREGVRRYLASLPPEYASKNSLEGRFRNRILPHLGDKLIRSITSGDVLEMLGKNQDVSPQTREHLRVAVQASFTYFVEHAELADRNPAAKVPKVEIPQRMPKFLRLEEIPRLIAQVPAQWKCATLVALGTAIRRSEVLGLPKANVLLEERTIIIDRTLTRDTTKGGKERRLPIPEWLVPFLRAQLDSAPGPLLFPRPDGKPYSKHVKLHEIIRRALVRAELVEGYDHVCRRCKAKKVEPHTWLFDDDAPRTCERCGFRLWAKGIAKPIRFKELRSTWATHAAAQLGDIRFVQKILGHGSVDVTERRYAFALPEHLKSQMGRVNLPVAVSGLQAPVGEPERNRGKRSKSVRPKGEEEQVDAKPSN